VIQTFKIRGAKHYRGALDALVEAGQSSKIQAMCVEAANRLAEQARGDDPRGTYKAGPADVVVGYSHEVRAGARVRQVRPGWGALRDWTMFDILQAAETGRVGR
jgi:hypothetical protein